MFTLMIFWSTSVGVQIHTSPMYFVSKVQCQVAAAQIKAAIYGRTALGYEKLTFVCVEGGEK